MNGFINIYKPEGLTSSNVVVKLRKKFHIDRIGHFGTLDPMACGVLPIAIGKATRMFDYYLAKYKTYKAIFQFGYLTNTLDREGTLIAKTDVIPSIDQVKDMLVSFMGKSLQIPPDFSAKLVNGVRAYKLAREGKKIELSAKEIEITKFDLLSNDSDTFVFEITCSSGTYIRSIARDLGDRLGTYCTMIALERTESGMFNINNSITLDEALALDNIEDKLIDLPTIFPKIRIIDISQIDYNKIRNGVVVRNNYNVNDIAFARYNNVIVGIVEAKDDVLKLKTFLME